jgi:threonine aldolase
MGGGMRQVGFLAAAGLYALQNNIDRLSQDHVNAKIVGEFLNQQNYIEYLLPVETNIVIFKLKDQFPSEQFLHSLQKQGIKAVSMGKNLVRFVFHLNQEKNQIDHLINTLKNIQ